MKFSPTVIAREIEAQSKRLHRVLPTGTHRSVDLRIVRHDMVEMLPYAHPPRDDLMRLCLFVIPPGKFLDPHRMWKGGKGFELPRVDGVAPLTDAETASAKALEEVDKIYAARDAALKLERAEARQAADKVHHVADPLKDEEALALIARHRGQMPVTVKDEAAAWREKWTADMLERIRALEDAP